MLNYAEELQKETGTLQFAIQGSHIFKKLCDIYLEFKVSTNNYYKIIIIFIVISN